MRPRRTDRARRRRLGRRRDKPHLRGQRQSKERPASEGGPCMLPSLPTHRMQSGLTVIREMDSWNYFNYFTEIEEYFWKKRGAHLLVSPLDWAIMETWQKAGVPLEAALKGIDAAFESYQRSRRGAGKALKSLAYCTDAVLQAAEEQLEAAAGKAPKNGNAAAKDPFSREELKEYFAKNVARIVDATVSMGSVG